MDNSKDATKSAMNDLNDNIKVFVKLSSKGDNLTNKRVFFFEENRETLQLQTSATDPPQTIHYKYDYIFSDYDNTQLIANTFNSTITQLICNERNMFFLTFGEASLKTNQFLFGYPLGNLLNKDSFFNYVYLQILHDMQTHFPYDNMLIEIYKITNEKFIVDYKEIIHDHKSNIIDEINAHIKSSKKNGMTSSSVETNELLVGGGHVIIRLKFFKYSTEGDVSKSQREVEILRAFTFIDIEGFSRDFTKVVMEENEQQLQKTNPKLHSLISFYKFIDSIASQDLRKFNEISSTLTDVLTEIFSIENLFTFVFGFIDKYENSVAESQLTLDLLNKCKGINNNVFYEYLLELNISISQLGNGVVREEYQILEMILSELLFYLERTFKPLDAFYKEIKDLNQWQKYTYLSAWLNKHSYDFISNKDINSIFDYVNIYYKSRARWKCLIKARDIILKLTENIKENEETIKLESSTPIKIQCKDSASKNNTVTNNKELLHISEHDNKIGQESNEMSSSKLNDSEVFLFMNEFPSYISSVKDFPDDHSNRHYYKPNPIKHNYLNNNDNRFVYFTGNKMNKFLESWASHQILKKFKVNMQKTFKSIFDRFTEETGCRGGNAVAPSAIVYDYSKEISDYKHLSSLQTAYVQDISAISKHSMSDCEKNYYYMRKDSKRGEYAKEKKCLQFNLKEQMRMSDEKDNCNKDNKHQNKKDPCDALSKRLDTINSKMNDIKKKYDSLH